MRNIRDLIEYPTTRWSHNDTYRKYALGNWDEEEVSLSPIFDKFVTDIKEKENNMTEKINNLRILFDGKIYTPTRVTHRSYNSDFTIEFCPIPRNESSPLATQKPGFDPKLTIHRVIFNGPATIVFWLDGTKTVVKADNESFDPEKGIAMAIAKKALGNQGNYYNTIRKAINKSETINDNAREWL